MSGESSGDAFTAFAVGLRAQGFTVSDAAAREMWAALPGLDALRVRLRRVHGTADEPAHVFHAARQGQAPEDAP